MASNWKDRLQQIEQRKAELKEELQKGNVTPERMNDIETESRNLLKEEEQIRRSRDLVDALTVPVKTETGGAAAETGVEKRAREFRETNRLKMPLFAERRSLLVSSGKIAAPTAAYQTIGELPSVVCSIVDDVHVIDATGTNGWEFPYQKTDAEAADVTEGSEIGGTAATYDKVEITGKEWGVLDEVSNQVAKMTNVNYTVSVQNAAYLALRRKARDKIVAAVKASSLTEIRNSVPLDETYIRDIVLNYDSDESVGEGKLYLNKADLSTLGKVRGTDKKPVYEITFTDQNNGTIKDGGTMVQFSICKTLATGEQIYGNPYTIKMLLWGDYEISTDQGGEYFKRNVMGVRGLATAGADLVVWHGMQLIKQAGG